MMKKIFLAATSVIVSAFLLAAAYGETAGTVANHAYAIGKGPGVTGYTSLLCASGQLAIGSATDPTCRTVSGDGTLSATGVLALATVNANVGAFGAATQCTVFTVNAKGLITAASQTTCTPSVASVSGLGTGVATALANNIGSAGAVVLFNGAGGTPTSLVLTNATGLPVASITGLGANCATFLATPSSANLRACLTDETGTGLAYFQGGDIGTPSAGVATNITGLNATQLTTGTVPAARLPNPSASTLGGVQSFAAVTSQWIRQISTSGVPTASQPAIGDISGVASNVPSATSNVNACANCIGAQLSNSAGALTLVSGVAQNAGTVNVPAGDWDLFCGFTATGSGGPTVTEVWVSINSTGATSVFLPLQAYRMRGFSLVDPLLGGTIGPFRVSQASSNNYFCVAQATFSGGTGFGITGTLVMRRPQ